MPWSDISPGKSWNDLHNASQVDQEAGTSSYKRVTSSKQHYHESASKAWINFTGTGTPSINDSYNVTSITDNGTGDYTINFISNFEDTNYSVTTNWTLPITFGSSVPRFTWVDTRNTNSCRVKSGFITVGFVMTAEDFDNFYAQFFGNQ